MRRATNDLRARTANYPPHIHVRGVVEFVTVDGAPTDQVPPKKSFASESSAIFDVFCV
jgi:hypothetical protein